MPVDLYVGGTEHAVLHLLYARFWHKVLFDAGIVSTKEPFQKLFNQGMILAWSFQDEAGKYYHPHDVEERDGKPFAKATGAPLKTQVEKMSKSRLNVVSPDEIIAEYGADAMRLYEMFMGPLEIVKPWQTKDIEGVSRFLQRVWRLVHDEDDRPNPQLSGRSAVSRDPKGDEPRHRGSHRRPRGDAVQHRDLEDDGARQRAHVREPEADLERRAARPAARALRAAPRGRDVAEARARDLARLRAVAGFRRGRPRRGDHHPSRSRSTASSRRSSRCLEAPTRRPSRRWCSRTSGSSGASRESRCGR